MKNLVEFVTNYLRNNQVLSCSLKHFCTLKPRLYKWFQIFCFLAFYFFCHISTYISWAYSHSNWKLYMPFSNTFYLKLFSMCCFISCNSCANFLINITKIIHSKHNNSNITFSWLWRLFNNLSFLQVELFFFLRNS